MLLSRIHHVTLHNLTSGEMSPELSSYPRNGPLPTVSPLDSYKLQNVFAGNWMSNFIATSIPLPPAANNRNILCCFWTQKEERNSESHTRAATLPVTAPWTAMCSIRPTAAAPVLAQNTQVSAATGAAHTCSLQHLPAAHPAPRHNHPPLPSVKNLEELPIVKAKS